MNRRHFLGALGAGACSNLSSAPRPRISAATIQSHLEALSVHGRPAGGTFASGVSRVGYSDAASRGASWSWA